MTARLGVLRAARRRRGRDRVTRCVTSDVEVDEVDRALGGPCAGGHDRQGDQRENHLLDQPPGHRRYFPALTVKTLLLSDADFFAAVLAETRARTLSRFLR